MTWKRADPSGKIEKQVDKIIASYSIENPSASVPALVNLLKEINALPESQWKQVKKQETEKLILLCAGIYAEATTSAPFIYQNDSLKLNINIVNRSNIPVKLDGYSIITSDNEGKTLSMNVIKKDTLLSFNRLTTFSLSQFVGRNVPISQPYWLINEKPFGYYDVTEQTIIGTPDVFDPFMLYAILDIGGEKIHIDQHVFYKSNDPVKGEVYQPVAVVPEMEVKFSQDNYLSVNEKPVTVVTTLTSKDKDTATYTVLKKIPDQWASSSGNIKFSPSGKPALADTSVFVPTPNSLNKSATLALQSNDGFAGYVKQIQYDHIPAITYFNPAKTHLMNLDIKIAGNNIGYIEGAGDKVAEDLQLLGYRITRLKPEDITPAYLSQFNAFITGIRAYNVHQLLTDKYDALMAYVQNGGNLIVQYNTSSNVGPLKAKMSPYPMNISRNRITDEHAAVSILLPNHPVLNNPNKITAKDFDGWIQERSIYHADQLDSHFVTPMAMADPCEQPNNGALAIAPYGKGNFIYTGLVFFRELPAGVPGAYRLMANLISLPKN
jgi:hypothetical protein